jgi:hypothetical protein
MTVIERSCGADIYVAGFTSSFRNPLNRSACNEFTEQANVGVTL